MSAAFTIESSIAGGQRIRILEQPARHDSGSARRALLFVHGATYPGVMFDVPGASWLERASNDGFDAYAVDIRGYGGSHRPAGLDGTPEAGSPFCRATDAAADIADAVAAIQKRAGVDRVSMVCWSWGTATAGQYAATCPGTIDRLVQFAPVYAMPNTEWLDYLADPARPSRCRALGAYRTETRQEADARWAAQITASHADAWRDPAILDAWFEAMLRDEPRDQVRAPNGVLLDLWEIFSGRPVYDAGAIDVPTLVVRGGADTTATRADALCLLDALGSEEKQYVELAHASHFALLERRRDALHTAVAAFLG